MKRREFIDSARWMALLGSAAVWVAVTGPDATAQVNCQIIPAGPERTDCYISLGRINRQRAEIAAGVARQQTDRAVYRNVTGKNLGKKVPRPVTR
jgi:hypothetical protein